MPGGRPGLATVLFAAAMLFLTACEVRSEFVVALEPDGSGSFGFRYGLDADGRALLAAGGTTADELFGTTSDPEPGLIEMPWRDGPFEGTSLTAEFSTPEELEDLLVGAFATPAAPHPARITWSDDEVAVEVDALPAVRDALDGFLADVAQAAEGFAGVDLYEAHLDDLIDLRFSISLPGDVVDHNGRDERDGTVVWDLLDLHHAAGAPLHARARLGATPDARSGLGAFTPLWGVALVVALSAVGLAITARNAVRRGRSTTHKPVWERPSNRRGSSVW